MPTTPPCNTTCKHSMVYIAGSKLHRARSSPLALFMATFHLEGGFPHCPRSQVAIWRYCPPEHEVVSRASEADIWPPRTLLASHPLSDETVAARMTSAW